MTLIRLDLSSEELLRREQIRFIANTSSGVGSELTVLRKILRLHAGSVGSHCHGYQRRRRSPPGRALPLLGLFFVLGAETGIFVFIVDRMMDCWHLTLKELIDALDVCRERLKLDGEKCADFIYFVLTHSNKGDSPVKQGA